MKPTPPGYAVVKCHYCKRSQRVEIGEDPEGWVQISTVRGKPIAVMCPECTIERVKIGPDF